MRVVHLSTSDLQGGAARSAWRLHLGLLELGCNSTMLVREKSSDHPTVRATGWTRSARERFWEGLAAEHVWANRTPISTTHFSLGHPGLDLRQEPEIQQAEIIHLHWVADFLSADSLTALAGLGKPLVWTLHDQRPFTGGCHFSAGCTGFEAHCAHCPQLRRDPWRITERILHDEAATFTGTPIQVVAPSQWLARLARRSRRFARHPVTVIPYGVSEREFFPEDKTTARRRLGLPEDAFLILSGADHAGEKRKGLDLLLNAFQPLPATTESGRPIRLLAFGRALSGDTSPGDRELRLGYLTEPDKLRAAYAAADVFVLPSLEDNLPNTMLEALACGTAVVAFAVGGVPDVLREGENGWLVPAGDSVALGAKLRMLADEPGVVGACGVQGAADIAAHYTIRQQAERYLSLYRSAAAEVQPTKPPRTRSRLRRAAPWLALDLIARRGLRHGWRQLREGSLIGR